MTGKARMISHCTTNDIHVNIGMRIRFIPGARMFTIVVAKLNAAASDETPRIWMPSTQKFMFWPGRYALVVSGVYANHPPLGADWNRIGMVMNRPPSKYTQ